MSGSDMTVSGTLRERIYWDRSRICAREREEIKSVIEREFMIGRLSHAEMVELHSAMKCWDDRWEVAMTDMVEAWFRSEQHRLYCLARTANSHKLYLEALRGSEVPSTDLTIRFDSRSFSIDDAGSNAPPNWSLHDLSTRSLMVQPRTLHGGPPI